MTELRPRLSSSLPRSVTDPRDGRKVALKKMPNVFQNLVSCKRVFRELRMLCFFKHDNVGAEGSGGGWQCPGCGLDSGYQPGVVCLYRSCRLLTFCSLHRSTASRKCILISVCARVSDTSVGISVGLAFEYERRQKRQDSLSFNVDRRYATRCATPLASLLTNAFMTSSFLSRDRPTLTSHLAGSPAARGSRLCRVVCGWSLPACLSHFP